MATPRRRSARPALRPRKKPTQERGQATVDAILQASAYILKKRGYAAMTTNAIAEKAGVNIASLYQYFPNKEAILVALMRRHVEETRRHTMAAWTKPGRSFERRLEDGIAGAIAVHAVEPELHRVFTTEALRLGLEPFETDVDASLKEEAQKWTRTTKRENPALALWILQTSIHAVIHAAFAERPDIAQDPTFALELAKLARRYLR